MRILVLGANGFVGRHLAQALTAHGHSLARGVRKASQPGDVEVDYRKDISVDVWLPRLAGIDAVVNAVGVLRDTARTPMHTLHAAAPCALFEACAQARISRVVHISALGVEGTLDTAYFRTKRVAEQCLFALPEHTKWLNLRPSLIYGEDGGSATLFRKLARMPLLALPMGGHQAVQPVHIDDIAQAVVNWLKNPIAQSLSISAVGAEATTLKGMIGSYRTQQGYKPACQFGIPDFGMTLAARLGDHIPASPLCRDTLAMLQAGNVDDVTQFADLLGYTPRSIHTFIP